MRKIVLSGAVALLGAFAANAQCKTVTGLNENFDAWKDIDKCWNAQSGKAMLYASEGRITFYSMTNPREKMMLSTPKIKAGTYDLSLDISQNGGEATLELFSADNPSDAKSFISIARPSAISGTKKTYTITFKKDTHLGLKVLLNGVHQAVYVDNVVLKAKN